MSLTPNSRAFNSLVTPNLTQLLFSHLSLKIQNILIDSEITHSAIHVIAAKIGFFHSISHCFSFAPPVKHSFAGFAFIA